MALIWKPVLFLIFLQSSMLTAIPTSTAKTTRVLPPQALVDQGAAPDVVTDPATLVAPQIISLNSSVVLQKGDNFSVVCSGSKPLLWIWKPFDTDSETGLNKVSSESDNTDISGAPLFRQVLHIQSAEWFNTRAYTCRFEDWNNYPDEKMALTSSQLFIFVSDPDNPFQEEDVDQIPILYYNQPIDLKCGVTDPRFKVTLEVNKRDITHQRGVQWDPQQGFRILDTTHELTGSVLCTVNTTDSLLKRRITVYDSGTGLGDEPPVPTIYPVKYRVLKGETLVLKCWVRVQPNVLLFMNFDYPKRGDPRFEETRPLRLNGKIDEITNTLTIKDIQPEDQGTYKCNTTLDRLKFQVASAAVEVFEKPYLSLTPMVKIVHALDSDRAVVLGVYVDCMSRYVIKWFFNGEELKKTAHNDWSQHKRFAKYAIKFPTMKDDGVYEAKAWIPLENGTLTNPQSVEITLIVHVSNFHAALKTMMRTVSVLQSEVMAKGDEVAALQESFNNQSHELDAWKERYRNESGEMALAVSGLKNENHMLMHKDSLLEVEMDKLNDKLRKQSTDIRKVEDRARYTVAFSASLGMGGRANQVTMSGGRVVKFRDVHVNEGNGYDRSTGVFTAPRKGSYVFYLTLLTSCNGCLARVHLKSGDVIIASLRGHDNDDIEQSSVIGIAELAAGDQVKAVTWGYTKLLANTRDDLRWLNLFSGQLVRLL